MRLPADQEGRYFIRNYMTLINKLRSPSLYLSLPLSLSLLSRMRDPPQLSPSAELRITFVAIANISQRSVLLDILKIQLIDQLLIHHTLIDI